MACLALMSDMLKNPKFDEAELEKLKTQELAGIEQNKTEPQFLVQKKLGEINQKYKKGHPLYSMSIEEDIEAIKAVTTKTIQAYYNDFYGISDNATLVVIGNFDEKLIKDYFETDFSNFKNNKPYTAVANKFQPNNLANEKIKTPDKKNAMSIGVLSFEGSQNDEDFAALQIAGEILGGGVLKSRITTRLRQNEGISYGAGGYVRVDDNDKDRNSSMLVYAIYAPENASKIQKGFREEIERFIKDGITEEELKVAVTSWVQGENVARAKDNELSSTINNNLYYDRDMMFQKVIEDKVTGLTVDAVNNVIKKYFKTFDNWTVVNAGDFQEFEIKNDDKKVD